MSRQTLLRSMALSAILSSLVAVEYSRNVRAAGPTLVDRNLQLSVAASGFAQPTGFAFIGANDVLVLEKASGRVIRVQGTSQTTVLDLAVNSGSERGLLGMALHPDFPATPQVFLYWTESSTGVDTSVLSETTLLGNRVDMFLWNGSTLAWAQDIIRIRAIQT